MKRHPIGTMVGGAILAAWIPFWTFLSGLSTIDFMRTSSGRPSIGTFYLPASLSAGLSVVGTGVMVYAFVLLYRRTSADHSGGGIAVSRESSRVAPMELSAHPTSLSKLPSRTLPDVFLNAVTLPDGRVISSCNLEDVIAVHKANTTEQAHRLLVGKWIKFPGTVEDISTDGIVNLASTNRSDPLPVFVLKFAEGWEKQLSALQRASSVTVRGQIAGLEYSFIRLKACELL